MIDLYGICKRGRVGKHESITLSGLFAGLSPRVQWLGPLATGRWDKQKLGDIDCQRRRQAVKQIDGRVELQALDFADRSAINLGFKGEVLLTDAFYGPSTSKIPSDAGASIHADDATNLPPTNLSDIADIFDNCSAGWAKPRSEFQHFFDVGTEMKIAVGIIGILLGLVSMLQSCAVATGGNILANQELAGAGSVGMLVGLLFFVGGAFAFGLPLVAAIVFVVGSFFAMIAIGAFPDMKIWAAADLFLAVMAFFAWRSVRRSNSNLKPADTARGK